MLTTWFRTTFEALWVPEYRILWAGSLFATLGFMMSFTVQAVVAFEIGGSNSAVGMVQLGLGASMLILGPMGGVIADRVSKRPLVFWGQVMVGVSLAATGVLLITGELTILWLTLMTALMGIAFSFMGPARQAWVGELVPRRLLPNAVALSQLSMSISRVGAPLMAGVMLGTAFIGAGGTYLFMASLYIIVVATLFLLPPTKAKPKAERRAVRTELMAGFRYVGANPVLRLLMLLFMALVVVGFTFQVVLPAFLERHLDRAPTDIGLILTVSAVSSLVASVLVAGMVASKWAWVLMLGGGVLAGVGFLLLSIAPNFGLAVLTMVVMGPGLAVFMLINNALIMANTSPAYFGRVMSLTMLAFGVQGVLALPAGILADSLGERQTLALGGFLVLGVVALGAMGYLSLMRQGLLRPRAERSPERAEVEAPQPVPAGRAIVPRPHGVAMMVGQKTGAAARFASGD